MAGNIKGLTVEIGGDTTKLGKALEDVNKKSRSLSSELGDINKMLKLDPGNTELLAQKQKVLAEAINNTSAKLDTLKQAEAQVQAQFERGEVSEEQVRALQREIIATERKLGSYENAAQETAQELEKMGSETEDARKDVDKLGDEAKDTGDQLDKAGGKASKFGETMGKVGSVAAKGMAALATAAGAAVTALAGATVSAAAYADEILTTSTVTGVSTDDLQAYSYAAELVDVSVETMTKSMAKNIKSMSSAQSGSKAYADAYKQLGISVTDANGNLRDGETVYWEAIDALGQMSNETERDALAMQLFGKSAQELNPLIEAGSEKMAELKQEAHDVGAVMSEESLAALGAFDDSLQRLKGSAGAAKNALGTVLLPELQMLTDAGGGLLADFTKNLNASGGGLGGLVSTLDSMSGQIGEVAGGLLSSLVSGVTGLLPSLGSVAISLVSTLATSLISQLPQLVSTGVELIVSVLNGLTSAIPQITSAITGMLPSLVSALVSGIPQIINGALSLFLAILDAIPQLLPPLIASIPQITMSVIDALLSATPQLISGALQFLLAIVDAIPLLIATLAPMIPEIVATIIMGLLDCLPQLIEAAVTLFLAIVEAIPQICVELIRALPQIWETMKAFWSQLPAKLWAILKSLVQNIVRWVTESREKTREGMRKVVEAAVNLIKELPGKIWTWLVNVVTKIGQWGANMAAKAKAAATRVVTTVITKIKELPGKVLAAGKDIVQGLWNGITGMTQWLKDKIKSFCSNALGAIKNFFGIKSPSRVMRDEVGKQLAVGLAKGIEDNADYAEKSTGELAELVLKAAQDRLDDHKVYNSMSLAEEVAYWDAVREQVTDGTAAKVDADKKYFDAKKELDEKLVKLEEDYRNDVKEVQDDLVKDIKAVNDAYDDAVAKRQSGLLSSMGLFSMFGLDDATSKDSLLFNMETQVGALEAFDTVMEKLSSRKGMDAGLLEELQGMGPKSLLTLQQIANMSDDEFAKYVGLYQRKNALALDRATDENAGLRAESDAQIEQLKQDAATDLAGISDAYVKGLAEIGVDTTASAKLIGEGIVAGVKDGMTAKQTDLFGFMSTFFGGLTDPAAGINGLTLGRDLAANFGAGAGSALDTSPLLAKLDGIYERLGRLQMVLDSGTLVGEIIDKIDMGLADVQLLRARGV